jgi:hypothetical protein
METVGIITLGLIVLLGVVFAAFIVLTILESAFSSFNDLEYLDDDENLFDEEHHVRPLLGVVHPKEKK